MLKKSIDLDYISTENMSLEEEKKTKELKDMKEILEKVEDCFDEVNSKLSLAFNLLSENILINDVGFKTEEIEEIKKQIRLLNK